MVLAWAVVVASVALVVAAGVVPLRQGSPADRSRTERVGSRPHRENITGRPAGPDAEDMAAEPVLGPDSPASPDSPADQRPEPPRP